jgi:Sec7-like guanine-nucleotide exchange factor
VDDPLDIALRKLLVDVGLPKETQQIDRVIEAFAKRYLLCNPNLFTSDGEITVYRLSTDPHVRQDHPYILAFSLIMLHTDAFNKSNKRKMTKADYIKNTRLPGVPPDVLDVSFSKSCMLFMVSSSVSSTSTTISYSLLLFSSKTR